MIKKTQKDLADRETPPCSQRFFKYRPNKVKPQPTAHWRQAYYNYKNIVDSISKQVSFKKDRSLASPIGNYFTFRDFVNFLSINKGFFRFFGDCIRLWKDFLQTSYTHDGSSNDIQKYQFKFRYRLEFKDGTPGSPKSTEK